ncbi:hypothetical protein [Phyllobacterium leguminum]|uniref:Uncharacterized protein n=1 Tax=Phyllobacterium leguminum TaxID=314237 RepID=A0A318T5F6_9HYPH|nr:hypothetical protein [Phyllobacterium leguminum]PYE88056.1 hypothetical protein C7477_109100 [Phyllobacterium leguminum]
MKFITFVLFASFAHASSAYAEEVKVHASIGADQMRVKAAASEVTWSSNLEDMQIGDDRLQKSGTFLLRCGDDGRQYAMVSIPAENDVWPTQSEELRIKADVAAFGSDLEIPGASLLSTKVGSERILYVDLGNQVSEIVRHWNTGMSVRVSVRPNNGLSDLSFIVAAPASNTDTREKIAKTVALCQLLAR